MDDFSDLKNEVDNVELEGDLNLFKDDVSKFNKIDKEIKKIEEQIKPLKEKLSEYKQQKLTLKSSICVYMDNNEIEKCNLPPIDGGGAILYKKKKLFKPLNKETIREELQQFFSSGPGSENNFYKKTDIQKATEVYDFLYENRGYRYSETLTCKR